MISTLKQQHAPWCTPPPEGLDPGAPREYLLQTANKESKQDREAPAPAPKELPPSNMAAISAEVPAPRGGHGGGGTHVFAAAPPEVRAPTGSEAPRLLKPRIDGQVSMKYDAVPAAAAKAVEQAVPSGSKGMNLNIVSGAGGRGVQHAPASALGLLLSACKAPCGRRQLPALPGASLLPGCCIAP